MEDGATIQHERAVKFDFRTGEAWAMSTLFAAFAAIAVYALEFVRARVPETKGLSLEEIERYFASGERLAGIESPLISAGEELVV